MRIKRWTLLWILVVAVLVVIEGAILTGVLSTSNLLGFFVLFVFGLVVVSVLAMVGAAFLGIFISHRILSTQEFTPFEEEMLRMRQEVRDLSDRLEAIASKLGAPLLPRTKGP